MVNNTDSFVISWRVWYDDGTSNPVEYKSTIHNLNELPQDGFQAMKLWYSNGYSKNILGYDYYFFVNHETGVIYGHSNESVDSILTRYPGAIIKYGRYVTEGFIHQIENLMTNSTNPLYN